MRRVSSRQRLVSWDAFDATAYSDDDASFLEEEEMDFVTCYEGSGGLSRNSSFASTLDNSSSIGMLTMTLDVSSGGGDTSTDGELGGSPPLRVRKRERPSSSSSSNHEQHRLQSPSSSSTRSMKKEVSFSDLTPILISAHRWEVENQDEQVEKLIEKPSLCYDTTTSSSSNSKSYLTLPSLMDEVQLDILSFLTASDARKVMLVSKHYFRLLRSKEAMTTLWTTCFQRQWPTLSRCTAAAAAVSNSCSSSNNVHFVNLFPSILDKKTLLIEDEDLNNKNSGGSSNNNAIANMSMLLGMAARHYPTQINQTLFATSRPHRMQTRSSSSSSSSKNTLFRTWQHDNYQDGRRRDNSNSTVVVQYIGPIGTGDRCIRADEPLPGPPKEQRRMGGLSSPFGGHNKASLLDFLCRGGRAAVTGSSPPWRPFVAPYVTTSPSKTNNDDMSTMRTTTQVHLTPRLVSYYEVSILPCPDDSPLLRRPTALLQQPHATTSSQGMDCVAIGISTSSFPLQSRMPGWDRHSYGYHGDDGGIFHASGDMTRRFGPAFGRGDVVGCGVDYCTNGIFFTLNGEFLGYGWTGIDMDFMKQDLYPTIGIDSNFPVECNFGDRPFRFDLTSVVERQLHAVKECWNAQRSSSSASVDVPSTSSAI